MSSPLESFATATKNTQEATSSALRTWSDGLQSVSAGQNLLADMPAMVGRYFDAVQQVLDSQRQFVEAMLGAAKSAQTFTDQALRASEESAAAMQTATKSAADIAKSTKAQTSAVARMAKAGSV